MRTAEQVFNDLHWEQQKLKKLPLRTEPTLKQSILVDKLIVEYYRALKAERRAIV